MVNKKNIFRFDQNKINTVKQKQTALELVHELLN